MNKITLTYLFCFNIAFYFSQLKPDIIWPLDSPRVLTGNFGELRPNHFHSGLDFSTNGLVNLQVYAIEEGYVSRVRVSSTGYGKSVYITHQNGKTSVYGHLNAFSLKIDKIVKEEQYKKQSFEIDLFPTHYSVFLRKNEIIGLSGNSGGSTGPHLHFELRDEKAETPLNPLNYYGINDHTSPSLEQIAFYSLTDTILPNWITSYPVHHNKVHPDTLLLPESILGFAFAGYDQFLPNGNHNNIYSAKLYLDGQLIYGHELKHIDFIDNRYINEYSEHRSGAKFQKCFLPTVYPPDFGLDSYHKGRIILKDLKSHKLKLSLVDESGNELVLSTYIKTNRLSPYQNSTEPVGAYVICDKETSLNQDECNLFIPSKTFYHSVDLVLINRLAKQNHLGIEPFEINMRTPIQVGFLIPEAHAKTPDKLVLISSHGVYTTTVRGDSLHFSIKTLGDFQLLEDREAPTVRSHFALKNAHHINKEGYISFTIHDQLSGISKYNLYINDQWVIAEYDAKSDLLIYYFDEQSPSGHLKLRLEVSDKVGNNHHSEYELNR